MADEQSLVHQQCRLHSLLHSRQPRHACLPLACAEARSVCSWPSPQRRQSTRRLDRPGGPLSFRTRMSLLWVSPAACVLCSLEP